MEKPKIRFKGYTDDWEQRKFSELYEKNVEKNTELIGYDKTISIATMTYKDEGNGASDESLKTYKVLRTGDLAFEGHTNKDFRYGRFVANDIGTGIMSPRFSTLRPVKDMPVSFWKYYIHYEPIMRSVLVNSTKAGTMMNELVVADFMKQSIRVPSIGEQEKIGEYFSNLDHLITLHQRKCEETKKLKKYMLQKMFPRNGQVVPEIRFSGFTDDWEQRKLGEVFEQTSNLVNPKEDEIELWSLTVEDGLTKKSDRYNREFLVKKDDNFKEVRPGDIVYNPMNMTLGAVGYNDMAKSVAVSGYYTTMVTKENYDTYYINTWLKSPQAIQLYRTYATGSLIEKQRVQFPTLSIIPVAFPKYEEQTKIGSYFHSLDHLITLHQNKCDELKKIKKFMLQNMFV